MERKEGLVERHKVGHFMVGVEAVASRLYHYLRKISHEGLLLHMQVLEHLI